MAVVTKYADTYPNPAERPFELQKPGIMGGRERVTVAKVEVANGDSATSKLFVAQIPSSAIILPGSTLYHDGITGLTDLDFGDSVNPDGLADGLNVAAAGEKSLMAALGIETYGQCLWELLGRNTDPNKKLNLLLTLNADAGAAGTLVAVIKFATD